MGATDAEAGANIGMETMEMDADPRQGHDDFLMSIAKLPEALVHFTGRGEVGDDEGERQCNMTDMASQLASQEVSLNSKYNKRAAFTPSTTVRQPRSDDR